MLIDLRELLSGSKDETAYDAHIDMDVVDNGLVRYDIVKKSPFSIEAVKTDKNKLHITCSGEATLGVPCDRCLETVDVPISFDMDDMLEFDSDNADEEQEEKDYIDGYNLDVDKLIFGELIVSMPGKVLCKEDCKGLCPVCGNNLNVAECGCDRDVLDPRMSVFKDILKNFKEV